LRASPMNIFFNLPSRDGLLVGIIAVQGGHHSTS
jgi:hypothetical protein